MIRASLSAALLSISACGGGLDEGDFDGDFDGTFEVVGSGPFPACGDPVDACLDCYGSPVDGWCEDGVVTCPVLDPGCTPGQLGTPGPSALWARVNGGTGQDAARAVAIGPDGSIVVVGSFSQVTNLGGDDIASTTPEDVSDTDLFVAKYTSSGVHLFSHGFGAPGEQRAEGVGVDAGGNIVVVGRYTNTIDFGEGPLPRTASSDLFVARFDASGALDWAKSFNGGANGTRAQVDVAPSGDIALAGATCGTIDLGLGETTGDDGTDIFVSRLDADGNAVFARRFTTGLEEWANDVAFAPSGDVFFAGIFSETIDFGTGPVLGVGDFDGFLTRLDPAGNALDVEVLGVPGLETAKSIAVSSSGDVAIVGTYIDPRQAALGGYVTGYMPDGTHRFTRLFTGADNATEGGDQFSVAFDPEGRIVIAGQFVSQLAIGRQYVYADAYYDIFAASLDLDGVPIAAQRIGNFNPDFAWGLEIDPATSDILLTGQVFGGLTLGLTHYNGKGDGDVYLARFKPEILSAN